MKLMEFKITRTKLHARTMCLMIFLSLVSPLAYAQTPGVGSYAKILEKELEGKSEISRIRIMNALWRLELKSSDKKNTRGSHLYHELRRLLDQGRIQTEMLIHDDHLGITFTKANTSEFLYLPNTPYSVGKIFDSHTYDTGINASYFSRRGYERAHSGLLYLYGEDYTNFVSNDPNITHVVCMQDNGKLHFITNDAFFPELRYGCEVAFQVGPMILQVGSFSDRLGQSTFDDTGHERTLMLRTKDELWFVTVRSKLNLWNIGNYVLNMPEFRDKDVDLINLDGGSSVAYFSKKYPRLNHGLHKKLPLLFGIRTGQ